MTKPDEDPTTGEPHLAAAASWLVLVASFGLSAATWIALARLAGFDGRVELLGLVVLSLAWLMPIAVDGYVVVALVLWLSPVPDRVARFAKVNTYAAAGTGVAAQSAYHCLTILAGTGVIWRAVLAAIVGALPPAVAALSVHMRALIRRESGQPEPDTAVDSPADTPNVQPQVSTPEPVDSPADTPATKTDKTSVPKRPLALTQQAAASMQAGGMSVDQIADALLLPPRQVRLALQPVPVTKEAGQ